MLSSVKMRPTCRTMEIEHVKSITLGKSDIGNHRRSSSDIVLTSGCEIVAHFDRLEDPKQVYDALCKLTVIANRQSFMLSSKRFDQIFKIVENYRQTGDELWRIDNSQEQGNFLKFLSQDSFDRDFDLEEEILKTPDSFHVWNQALSLLDKIASFSLLNIKDGLMTKHINILLSCFPYHYAVKVLGKLVAKDDDYCSIALKQGPEYILKFYNMAPNEVFSSLFVWYLGCFGYYESLFQNLLPLYDSMLIGNFINKNDKLVRNCINTLTILAENSEEARKWIIEHDQLSQIFSIEPNEKRMFMEMLGLLNSLVKNCLAIVPFITSQKMIDFYQRSFLTEDLDIILGTITALIPITQITGFGFLHNNGFDMKIMAIYEESPYEVKKAAALALCYGFMTSNTEFYPLLIDNGIIKIITDCMIENNVKHEVAGSYAMLALWHYGITINDPDILDIIIEAVGSHAENSLGTNEFSILNDTVQTYI